MSEFKEGMGWSDRVANGVTIPPKLDILIPSVPRRYDFAQWPTPKMVQDALEKEIEKELHNLYENYKKQGKRPNGRDTQQVRERVRANHRAVLLESQLKTALWLQSERILGVIRTRGLGPALDVSALDQRKVKWTGSLKLQLFSEANQDSPLYLGTKTEICDEQSYAGFIPPTPRSDVVAPNEYFALTCPGLVWDYGHAFHAAVKSGTKPGSLAKERVFGINTDFFGAYLGGDKRFGHDVVYFVPENTFYFYDPMAEQYLPTTDDKMRLWLSMTIQERAWGQEVEQASLILNQFRRKNVLDDILGKAKAILATEEGCFSDSGARVRFQRDRGIIDRIAVTVQQFIEKEIDVDETSILTITECLGAFEAYQQDSGAPLPSCKEIKVMVQSKIREIHGKGLRNDLVLDNKKCVAGWRGLRLEKSF